jgi:glycosyltransferase involved in cell wall biosynthesis
VIRSGEPILNSRIKISVCIASYEGERYIAMQLRSILEQIREGDEIIIVDDASTDNTCAEVLGLNDPRIALTRNARNRGVLRAFEAALSQSSGELVFLSDQDDVWLPGKVETIVKEFEADPGLMLVASDAVLIDDDGFQIGDSFYAQRGKFRSGILSNLLIGKFHGCTMAFRSALLRDALPFPSGEEVHHDTWIGCLNSLVGGKTKYIEAPLVAYRRHSKNVTGRIRQGNYKRFRVRVQLLSGLIKFWVRRARSAPQSAEARPDSRAYSQHESSVLKSDSGTKTL